MGVGAGALLPPGRAKVIPSPQKAEPRPREKAREARPIRPAENIARRRTPHVQRRVLSIPQAPPRLRAPRLPGFTPEARPKAS
jgi:hypothetical protein